ncbi:unnamed protein product [Acanthoscelides obtectus]|uniref:DNA polymerase delta subunit 3 n=1 Tax=Acanthoscelides obtectus TaxID=200917 RepID=A0A9P0P2D1_ACAOB|nr:unnamed protein product [Acanthoscelides obtectus]CAK1669593.1 DNA polymerase delta subunit 3 [Acanthoscelides obtectus]
MDTETEELYFQKLQEFVIDNDQIVTVPFLARSLGIPLQESQRLISKYVEDRRKLDSKQQLSVTYTVMGTLKNGKGDSIMMFDNSNIKEKESLFDKIHSDIIFSVQKNNDVDFNIIALVDKFDASEISDEPLPGCIIGKECVKRNLKIKKLPSPPPTTIKGKSAMFMPKTNSPKSSEDFPSKKPESKGSTAISDMFSKAPVSKATEKDDKKTSAKDTKPTNKGKGTLSNFFSQGSTKSSFECSQDDIDVTEFMEVDFQEDLKKVENEKENEVEKETKMEIKEKKEIKKSNAKKKRGRSQGGSEEKNTKRRKRIIERNDSDSDDLFGNESDEEDVIEKSDEEIEKAPPPVTVTEKQESVKGKVRKAVDKTYMDKDGFLVTTTDYEYVSAAEDEVAEPVKDVEEEKPIPKPIEKKNSASSNESSPRTTSKTKKGKKNAITQNQPTLMNFFKKK